MQSITNRLSSATQTISQACLVHPNTAIALTTLFFAKVVEANTGETAQTGPWDHVIDWLSQDTGIKAGAFGVLVISVFFLWRLKKGNVAQTPQKLAPEAADTAQKLAKRGAGGSAGSKELPRPEKEGDGGEASTVVRRPAAATKKTGAGNKGDSKLAKRIEFEVPPTPGKVDFDPFQMRETTEKALRDTFTWPRQNGLLCYLLAARMMQDQKFAAAKEESKKGHKFVATSKDNEDIRAQFLLQIQQCQFAGVNDGHANSNLAAAKKRQVIVPETPGVVNLSPDQMVDNAVDALIPLFINYDQYAQLCLLVAVDLLLANNFVGAKAIAKKGYYLRTWADDNVRISTKMEKCGKAPKDLKGTEIGKKFEDLMAKCNDLIKIQEQAKAKARKPLPQPNDGGRRAEQGATGAANKGPTKLDDKPPPPPPREEEEESFDVTLERKSVKLGQSILYSKMGPIQTLLMKKSFLKHLHHHLFPHQQKKAMLCKNELALKRKMHQMEQLLYLK